MYSTLCFVESEAFLLKIIRFSKVAHFSSAESILKAMHFCILNFLFYSIGRDVRTQTMRDPAQATVFPEVVFPPRDCAILRTVVEPVVHVIRRRVESDGSARPLM